LTKREILATCQAQEPSASSTAIAAAEKEYNEAARVVQETTRELKSVKKEEAAPLYDNDMHLKALVESRKTKEEKIEAAKKEAEVARMVRTLTGELGEAKEALSAAQKTLKEVRGEAAADRFLDMMENDSNGYVTISEWLRFMRRFKQMNGVVAMLKWIHQTSIAAGKVQHDELSLTPSAFLLEWSREP